jgi:hypothetical protein
MNQISRIVQQRGYNSGSRGLCVIVCTARCDFTPNRSPDACEASKLDRVRLSSLILHPLSFILSPKSFPK